MSDIFQYLSENANYQSVLNMNKEENENYKEEKNMSLMGFAEASPMLAHLTSTAKNVYTKGSEIYTKASQLAEKSKTALANSQKAIEEGADKLKGTADKAQSLVEDTVNKSKSLIENTTDRAKGVVSNTIDQTKALGDNVVVKGKGAIQGAAEEGQQFVGKASSRASGLAEDVAERSDPHSMIDSFTSFVSKKANGAVKVVSDAKAKISGTYGEKQSRVLQNQMDEADPESIAGLGERSPTTYIKPLADSLADASKSDLYRGLEEAEIRNPFSSGALSKGVEGMGTEMKSVSSNAIKEGQGLMNEGQNSLVKTGESLEKTGNEVMDAAKGTASNITKSATSAVSETVEEGSNAAKAAVQGAKAVGEEVASTVAETAGSVVAEAVPVIGDLVGIGMTIYDLVHSFADAPKIYSEARPVMAAGL
jgi:hypothetical protein